MFKNKLNNYIVSEILKSYTIVLVSLSLLIWVAQAARFLNLITESGLSIKVYLNYICFIFPKIFSQLMIISFLISLFLSILKFQDNKEIEIFWLSGMSKIKFTFLILKVSLFPTLLALIFYIFLVPSSNFQSRFVIANSEFSMVNSLVKKKNFNSPLKKLVIFVHKNDNMGNLEKIYIFEELKTIIAKKGRVININEKNYLELSNGFIHEKNENNNITVVKFEKTVFDFTKYQTEIVKDPKLQEISTSDLIVENKKLNEKKNKEYLYEIHKRIFKPLFIPIISILCCFILYTNQEKINLNKLKIFIFSISTLLIIFIEVLLNLSIKNILFQYSLYIIPLLLPILLILILANFLKNEPIYK